MLRPTEQASTDLLFMDSAMKNCHEPLLGFFTKCSGNLNGGGCNHRVLYSMDVTHRNKKKCTTQETSQQHLYKVLFTQLLHITARHLQNTHTSLRLLSHQWLCWSSTRRMTQQDTDSYGSIHTEQQCRTEPCCAVSRTAAAEMLLQCAILARTAGVQGALGMLCGTCRTATSCLCDGGLTQ